MLLELSMLGRRGLGSSTHRSKRGGLCGGDWSYSRSLTNYTRMIKSGTTSSRSTARSSQRMQAETRRRCGQGKPHLPGVVQNRPFLSDWQDFRTQPRLSGAHSACQAGCRSRHFSRIQTRRTPYVPASNALQRCFSNAACL